MDNDVLYLCNGKRCGNDHDCGECRHTLQIEYAANFQRIECEDGVVFFKEKESIRPHGEWIIEESNIFNSFVCSNCKEIGASDFNFCPNCGADMREAHS